MTLQATPPYHHELFVLAQVSGADRDSARSPIGARGASSFGAMDTLLVID
jgi:hypothetical protein